MRVYFKYLIIGWSIVCLGLIFFISQDIGRRNIVREKFIIPAELKETLEVEVLYKIYLDELGKKIKQDYKQEYSDLEAAKLAEMAYNKFLKDNDIKVEHEHTSAM